MAHEHELCIGADKRQWKTRHVARNPHVSLTIPIAKRGPLMPWIRIPPATITFSGLARVLEREDVGRTVFDKLYRHDEARGEWCAIAVVPQGDFVTYGIGVSLLDMRHPAKARGRAPVMTAQAGTWT